MLTRLSWSKTRSWTARGPGRRACQSAESSVPGLTDAGTAAGAAPEPGSTSTVNWSLASRAGQSSRSGTSARVAAAVGSATLTRGESSTLRRACAGAREVSIPRGSAVHMSSREVSVIAGPVSRSSGSRSSGEGAEVQVPVGWRYEVAERGGNWRRGPGRVRRDGGHGVPGRRARHREVLFHAQRHALADEQHVHPEGEAGLAEDVGMIAAVAERQVQLDADADQAEQVDRAADAQERREGGPLLADTEVEAGHRVHLGGHHHQVHAEARREVE